MVYLLAMLAVTTNLSAQSCCCASTGSNWSIMPNLEKHVLGARYYYKTFYSVYPHSLNPELSNSRIDEQLHTLEVFGRFNIAKRFQLSVFLPVNIINQTDRKGFSQNAGLGDMSFMLQYGLLDPRRCNGKFSKHQLRLGAGVKLPSGQFSITAANMFATSLQLGTGSVDFLFNGLYTYRFKQFGFNLTAAYRINTVNPYQYKFGDRAQAGTAFFYVIPVKNLSIMPQVGINYDHGFFNKSHKEKLTYTGGDFMTATIGIDIYYKSLAFTTAFTPALVNRLNWSGELRQKYFFEAGVFYNFQTKKTSNK